MLLLAKWEQPIEGTVRALVAKGTTRALDERTSSRKNPFEPSFPLQYVCHILLFASYS
jgi:hypothetical protein